MVNALQITATSVNYGSNLDFNLTVGYSKWVVGNELKLKQIKQLNFKQES